MKITQNATEETQVDRLLRCRRTQHYFNGWGWTADLTQAKTFSSQLEAVRDCIRHSLIDVDLVLRAPRNGADIFTTAVR